MTSLDVFETHLCPGAERPRGFFLGAQNVDLTTLINRRAEYLAAESKILQGQEYSIDVDGSSRRLRRADLAEVRAAIADLDARISRAQAAAAGRRRVRTIFSVVR